MKEEEDRRQNCKHGQLGGINNLAIDVRWVSGAVNWLEASSPCIPFCIYLPHQGRRQRSTKLITVQLACMIKV